MVLSKPSSRLIVKNVPRYVKEERLREHFAAAGAVTDVSLMRTRDGRSRCFAFVGYKSDTLAAEAQTYFNKTYMDTCQLSVEFAESFKTFEKRKEEGDVREGKGREPAEHEENLKLNRDTGIQKPGTRSADRVPAKVQGSALEDFLELMRPRGRAKTYANNEAPSLGQGPLDAEEQDGSDGHRDAPTDNTPNVQPPAAGSGGASENEVEDMAWLRGRVNCNTAAHYADGRSGGHSAEERAELDGGYQGPAAGAADVANARDKAYFEAGPGISMAASATGPPGGAVAKGDGTDEIRGAAASVAETGRLFLRNLPYTAMSDDVRALCEPYGSLAAVQLITAKGNSGQSRGLALVTFTHPADAVAAHAALDGSIFQGRLLHVMPGQPPRQKKPVDGDDGEGCSDSKDGMSAAVDRSTSANFKAQRARERKARAGDQAVWSTLYARDDTVAEAAAAMLGVTKAELLDPAAGDAAVRLALAEAQVMTATEQELETAGVNFSALSAAAAASKHVGSGAGAPRSETVLLLKNLPYAACEGELRNLFSGFGTGASRVVLPSTHVFALVEMGDAHDARAAFRALAYRRYHDAPLYLEFAPDRALRPAPVAAVTSSAAAAGVGAAAVTSGEQEGVLVEGGAEPACTLFVKNVAFATSREALHSHFERAARAVKGRVRSARIAMAARSGGRVAARGFAFVEFADEATAAAVMQRHQGSVLDGHALELHFAAGSTTDSEGRKEKARPREGESKTKLLVRNLAFEATASDVRAVLEAFGHVKTCRVPRKFDGSRRGFAFVEFGTPAEARRAVMRVHGTHLYGRRLLLEYAQEEEGLDELRAKAAEQLGEGGSKRKRARVH